MFRKRHRKLFPCNPTENVRNMNVKEQVKSKCFGDSSLPVLDLVGPCHIIDVHSYFVGDVGRQIRG